ncbi:MAG: hypothetical protein RBU27_09950 [Bacteroidota bacterium]|jgi:hypothetical protein|nr:hypothetical protein [Bacteroidota bacterium]
MQFFFLRSLLVKLDRGSLLRRINAIMLYLFAAMIVIGLIYVIGKIIGAGGAGEESTPASTEMIIFGIIAIIAILAAIVIEFQIFYLRANLLWNAENSRYGAMQVLSTVVKAYGEGLTTLVVLGGFLAMIAIWLLGAMVLYWLLPVSGMLPIPLGLADGSPFIGGVLVMIDALIVGVVLLTFAHFISESIIVLGDMATQLGPRQDDAQHSPAAPSASGPPPLP